MSLTPNSANLFLRIENEDILVQHVSGEVIVKWRLSLLSERFLQKIPALLFVSARTEQRGSHEYFHFYRCQLMRGTTTELLGAMFKKGILLVDLRLHDQGSRARNHGTGFRIYEKNLYQLFQKIEDI